MVHVRVKEKLCNFCDINAQERSYVIAHVIFATSTFNVDETLMLRKLNSSFVLPT